MSLSVKIAALTEEDSSNVHAEGEIIRTITKSDQKIFGLGDKELETAVSDYLGKKPDGIYLHSPTPWGNLFEDYKLSEITTTLKVKSSKVLEVTKDILTMKSEDLVNDSSVPAKMKTAIEEEVKNTVSSSWSSENGISVDQSIKYDIVVVSGETKFSYKHSWGVNKSISESVTLKSSSAAEVELQPNQAVLVELKATKKTMKVEIVYEASLDGTAVVNYTKPYNGHHFHFPTIHDLMKHADLNNSVTATEVIEIEFYFDSQIVVKDKETNEVL